MLINPELGLRAVADGIVVGPRVVIVDCGDCGGARGARALAVVIF